MRDETSDLLGRLEQEERLLSLRRRRLHERIDFLRGDPGGEEQLGYLVAQEHELSTRRLELHEQINGLRSGGSSSGHAA